MSSKPKKYQHLLTAPKNLLDVSYVLAVAKREIPPSEFSLTAIWPEKYLPADQIEDRQTAYGHGYSQGWECEMGGRAFLPTPPVGLPVALLPSFCEGIMAGSENVRRAREASSHGGESGHEFDPFADIDHHDL